jgi:hypothetical protein
VAVVVVVYHLLLAPVVSDPLDRIIALHCGHGPVP